MKNWTWAILWMVPFALAGVSPAQNAATLPLMPLPASVQLGEGWFAVDDALRVSIQGGCDARVAHAMTRFFRNLSLRTGMPLRNNPPDAGRGANFTVTCTAPGESVQKLGEDESYHLQVIPAMVRLDAANPLGVLHGLQTFLQLVRPGDGGFGVPAVNIEDRSRFPWRGLLIDVSRHFMPVSVIERNLDGMEAVKLNVLHWHLSDDQGFRVESKRFPQFQKLSSDGMFYTQEQIKEILEYARDRGIRVVPEFDMPGHSTSWFVAYPELASNPGPYQIERKWGVFDPAMDPTRESTYQFLDEFIGEMAALFPDQYFHIGGDEVNGKAWNRSPGIHEFMQKHGIRNNHDLQAYFNKRMQEIVNRHEKIMTGWDEILHPDLPQQTVVQSWRGQKSLATAARGGYRGILSSGYYLDLMFPAARHYSVDPLGDGAAGLTGEEKQRILGGEACMWAEFVTPGNVDGRIWPRAAAVAERLWSPENVTDVNSMYSRLEKVSGDLNLLGLKHNSGYHLMLSSLSNGNQAPALQVLADILEPIKEYGREKSHEYNSLMPLNRLVDAVHPESAMARKFAGMVETYLNHSSSPAEVENTRQMLVQWRDNDAQLEPILQGNALLTEVIPLSQSLQAVATAGIQAIEFLNRDGRAPMNWRAQQLVMLKQAEKPQAELLNMIVPAVAKLVAATKAE